jgi:large subunit ribosomal protein L4
MAIKTFEYNVFDITSVKRNELMKVKFSLKIANKAKYIIHRAIKHFSVSHSQYTSSTKTKSEVRGGGRKPWKQKGTGRARAGSNRSPLWRGGGVIFGPKIKEINKKFNKKENRLAIRTILYNKQKCFLVFKSFDNIQTKTKAILEKLNILNLKKNFLVISSTTNTNLKLAVQNLKNCNYLLANQLNVNALIKAKQIIIDEISFKTIQELYCE